MVRPSRGILALGLSLAGVAYLVAPSLGQPQQQQAADTAVRKAGNTSPSAASGPKPPIPPVIGTIDLDVVFKNYEKVKSANKEFNEAMKMRRGEGMKNEGEGGQEGGRRGQQEAGGGEERERGEQSTRPEAR